MNKEKISLTVAHVKHKLSGDTTGHDWFHIERVWKMARRIGEEEDADPIVVELAALLHDIADWKFHNGDETTGPRAAREWLESTGVDKETIRHVCSIIAGMSFKGAGVDTTMPTLEGRVVQDADRLDAIGAIGIARAFAYGGHKGRELHNPSIEPRLHATFEQYKSNAGPTVNHFYEKLLLLKERMNTETGKRIAEERHQYMEEYLVRFIDEWNGKR